jgi:hypothetical protein
MRDACTIKGADHHIMVRYARLCRTQWYLGAIPDFFLLLVTNLIKYVYYAFFLLEIKLPVLRCDKGERVIAFKLYVCVCARARGRGRVRVRVRGVCWGEGCVCVYIHVKYHFHYVLSNLHVCLSYSDKNQYTGIPPYVKWIHFFDDHVTAKGLWTLMYTKPFHEIYVMFSTLHFHYQLHSHITYISLKKRGCKES